jgi:hypothetical protein
MFSFLIFNMADMHTFAHAAQAAVAAHPEAVHRITQTLSWLKDGFGLLRSLEWLRNKYLATRSAKNEGPRQAEEQHKAA